ncbi:Ricin B-like lectin [Sesbania bispinosa]|nr:Ricin B-like lectin [Sesbania bispinosa]
MEFPFNHGHHNSNVTHTHHHHRRNDEEQPAAYPPPGNTFSPFNNAPQPPFYADHSLNSSYPPPPPVAGYSTPVPNATVHHVSHQTHHTTTPYPPSNVHHVSHQVPTPTPTPLSNKPTFKVVTKAAPNYSLTIRHGQVILAPSDPSNQYQHWYKDEKYSTRVKDEEGCPAFALVNKVTGEAIKHSTGATHPVRLIPYNPDYLDESILWTESRDLGDSYRAIRMVNNVHLNVDAYHGDKNSGGVHDGTTIVLWDWNKGDNQRWKILPY